MIGCVVVLSILLLTGSYSLETVNGRQINDGPPNQLSFASIGAISLESRMDAWATIDSTFRLNNTEAELENVRNSLQVRGIPDWITTNQPGMIEESCDAGEVKITISGKETNPRDKLVLVSITTKDSQIDVEKYGQELSEKSDLDWHYNYTYSGEMETAIDKEKIKLLSQILLNNIGAVQTNEFRQNETFSIQARSQKQANENYQLAIKREEQSGKTKVWIGIPLIMNDY
ncbi:MAG TPA: YwmB family TATA-box binding protein [Syntrophomonadaceae bacterium]|nr:YwmB family TATA-box binding protein [Syntrophomonadaceae bacterium]